MQEKTIQTKNCKHCNSSFEITDKDLEFYEKVSPIFEGKKFSIPTPNLCPNCRLQRKIIWRNERNIYKRKCDFSGKDIMSVHSPDKKSPICEQKDWWNDKCNPLDYGINFNFNKTFFEQFKQLQLETPKMSLFLGNTENSEYTNHGDNFKDCYLIFASTGDENCMYGNYVNNSKDSIDNLGIRNCQLAYDCTDCQNGYNIKFCEMSNDCSDSTFLYNCNSCKNCFLCSNLTNKEFYYLNKQYAKQEYQEIINSIKLSDNKKLDNLKQEFNDLKLKTIRKNIFIENSENVYGDLMTNSKNCDKCFDLHNSEDSKYIVYGDNVKSSQDIFSGYKTTERCYEVGSVGAGSHSCLFCYLPWGSTNVIYCINTLYSKNCFGCTDIKNKEYCILNKQYTKEQYNKLVPKIIEHMQKTGEWGEFFPSSISPFGYNETVAQEYFPLTKKEAEEKGFNWSDYEPPTPKVEKIIPAEKLPDNIKDIPDDILNWAIMPEKTENTVGTADLLSLQEIQTIQKPFRIIKQELEFYRKHNLPIPRKHPDQRHLERMQLRSPRKLFDRKCDKCGVEMKTTYSLEREEIVYCEKCYNKEVY